MKDAERDVVALGHLIDTRSVEERVRMYRSLARTTARPAIAEHFFACADELEAAEKKIGQRTLDFGRPEVN